jgi:hypothetical protein
MRANGEQIETRCRSLAALTRTAILATAKAAADDESGAAVRIEETRYERAILDFEARGVRRERDRIIAEYLENQRVILAEAPE